MLGDWRPSDGQLSERAHDASTRSAEPRIDHIVVRGSEGEGDPEGDCVLVVGRQLSPLHQNFLRRQAGRWQVHLIADPRGTRRHTQRQASWTRRRSGESSATTKSVRSAIRRRMSCCPGTTQRRSWMPTMRHDAGPVLRPTSFGSPRMRTTSDMRPGRIRPRVRAAPACRVDQTQSLHPFDRHRALVHLRLSPRRAGGGLAGCADHAAWV